jgi:DNA-binding SARP family transcriptional activator/pimeloyl-ACP methyl ester carboxylesterase
MGNDSRAPLRFGVLGLLQAVRGDQPVRLGGVRQRALLALLLLHANELVRLDQLTEALFGEQQSESAVQALRVAVLRLRRALVDEPGDTLRTHPGGYVLTASPEQFDLAMFEHRLHSARGRLAADDPARAAKLLRDALALWRGPPLADLALIEAFQSEIRRLEALRLLALMERIDADLALGGAAELVPEIETLVAADPLQERLRRQLMLALYRAGRQADALRVYRETSDLLRNELGLEPSRALQQLERSILQRDETLEPVRELVVEGGNGSGSIPSAKSFRQRELADVAEVSETRYAKSGEVHIAYQVVTGSGAVDLVAIPPGVSNVDLFWEQPLVARFFRGLGSFSRMALFDKRGSGMSDRAIGHPTLEARMDDTRAVMDAVGMERAALIGYSHGGPMAVLFAATYPERVSSLVLFGTFARLLNTPGFDLGSSREQIDGFVNAWAARWGTHDTLTVRSFCPSLLGDEEYLRWINRFELQSATPADLHATMSLDCEIDVRQVLGSISAPTLVIHRTGDRITRVEQARWIAGEIPGAEYLELPGDDHFPYAGDQDTLLDAIKQFVTAHSTERAAERILATVLRIEPLDQSAGTLSRRALLDTHDRACHRELKRFEGRSVRHTGDGLMAVFDGPARGIRCAVAIVARLRALGISARAGLHTGECDRRGDDISGTPVDIAARITALAKPGEVLVSRTVSDLIAGSHIALVDRGEHNLHGAAGRWRVYAIS